MCENCKRNPGHFNQPYAAGCDDLKEPVGDLQSEYMKQLVPYRLVQGSILEAPLEGKLLPITTDDPNVKREVVAWAQTVNGIIIAIIPRFDVIWR